MAALLTHKDAAKKLGVARHTLRRWVNADVLRVSIGAIAYLHPDEQPAKEDAA